MYEVASKTSLELPQQTGNPVVLTLAGYCYTVRQGMKVQLVTPYRVSLATLRRYGTR